MIRFLLSIVLLVFLGGAGFVVYLYDQIRHDVDALVHYKPDLTTTIHDKNGQLIANLFEQNRKYVFIDEVPGRVIEALVAIEDTKFYEHNGINVDAIIRAVIKDIKAGGFVEGASTITQQLVKTKLLSRDKKIMRKIKEALLAMRLETLLSKDEILERYLNEVYFGHGYYGIKTAANGYFDKPMDALSLKEIAMLVGLPRAPSYYDPTRRYDKNLQRANQVITRMKELGWIDEEQYLESIQETPRVYDQTLSQNQAPFVVDEVLRRLELDDIKTGGYRIETTIDLYAQQLAKEALNHGYEKILQRDNNASQLNGAIVVNDEKGRIQALVGGVDYKKSNYNRATQSTRQPGSSFKPLIYQSAIDLGYSPATMLHDVARTYEYEDIKKMEEDDDPKLWQPRNYEEDFAGLIPMKDALVHSRNLATINLVQSVGFNNIYQKLKKLDTDLPKNLSLALGNLEASPIQMAKFYSMFINGGTMVEPILIDKVRDETGEVILQNSPAQTYFTSKPQSFLMVDLLKAVVDSGTGRRVKLPGVELGGKTGTTNDNIDAWFCGFSPSLQAVVWFGRDDNKPMGKRETGGRAAGPSFKYFFERYIDQYPQIKRSFDKPEGVYEGKVGDERYFFTETSPLPKEREQIDDNLLF